jgi:acetyl esterase/lipase
MPPLLLIHGTNERLWEQGLAMRDRLAAAGARHELLAIEGAPHGMENWEGRPDWTAYKARLVEWLRERTGVTIAGPAPR